MLPIKMCVACIRARGMKAEYIKSFLNFVLKMSGQYWRSLGNYAKEQAAKLRLEKQRVSGNTDHHDHENWAVGLFKFAWKKPLLIIGGDWIFLALLGIIMALLSFTMDLGIDMCFTGGCYCSKVKFNEQCPHLPMKTYTIS